MNQADRIKMIWSMIVSYDYESDNGAYRDYKRFLSEEERAKFAKAEHDIHTMIIKKVKDGHEIYDREAFE